MRLTNNEITVNNEKTSNHNGEDEIYLSEQAKYEFNFYNDILHSFETYRQYILHHESITEHGRYLALAEINRSHINCKKVLNYVAENKSILSQSLPTKGPLVICGLPRTGTTLLYNLLSCDKNCRAPLFTDMCIDIVPPIARSDSIQQQKRINTILSSIELNKYFTNFRSRLTEVHPAYPIEEDYLILRQATYLFFFTYISNNNEIDSDIWLNNEMEKDYAYDYHEIFLRMLNSVDMPSSHWLLKSPMHCLYFDTFLRHYPNASFVITHRHLDEVLPSLCSLSWELARSAFEQHDVVDPEQITKRCWQLTDRMIDCIMKFYESQKENMNSKLNILFNVTYNDLMSNPIDVVHRIYDHFGLDWSTEFEITMQQWLVENPQGKQGRHSYSLKDFNLKFEEIETHYADYTKTFLA
ncbi:unnamed protein product [Rotaria sp. Silwood2]|nr:unnamed protein product [Rotaria sp. Silwood2]CAF3230730.1 unnamed protein product [Rotaria sp. Silwood2]CAF3335998.1 unnamed protein product [Rotaria sp. Silwood2]CAF4360084.1 unnamed protein product [Rotaria sp. Silwood2]CAF4363599.1 unnamed protein product [Rotaria sp. Silwood2]